MSKRIVLSASLLFCLPAISAADDAEKALKSGAKTKASAKTYLLRYRFRTNQVVHYKVTHTSTIVLTKGGFTSKTRNESTTRKHFDVISVDEKGTAILEPVIDHVKMSAQFGDAPPTVYDSAEDKKPPRGYAGVAKTIGKPLVRLKVTARGRLVAAIPLLSRKVQAGVVKNAGPAKASNDPSKNFLPILPEKPVRVGESWSDRKLVARLRVTQGRNGLFQEFPILRTYRLESVKDNLATIRLQSASLKVINEPSLQAQMVQRLPSATIVFDLRRGLIVSRTFSTDRRVFGVVKARSVLHVVSHRKETLVERPKTASAKKTAKGN